MNATPDPQGFLDAFDAMDRDMRRMMSRTARRGAGLCFIFLGLLYVWVLLLFVDWDAPLVWSGVYYDAFFIALTATNLHLVIVTQVEIFQQRRAWVQWAHAQRNLWLAEIETFRALTTAEKET